MGGLQQALAAGVSTSSRKILSKVNASSSLGRATRSFSRSSKGRSSDSQWRERLAENGIQFAALAGGVGVAVYLLPLPETKKGFSAALSGRGREPVGWLYTYACGAAGSVAGFFGTTAYISSAASRSPLMAGLKTPYALFGAFLGGQLSFHLGPAIVDISRSSAQIVGFTVDGFIADTVGRPKGQAPAWERSITSSSPYLDEGDEDAGGGYSIPAASPGQGNGADDVSSEAGDGRTREQELGGMMRQLVVLRRREQGLKEAQGAARGADRAEFRVRHAKEMRDITDSKARLKVEARVRYGVKLARHMDGEIEKQARELTQLRLRQVALARELGEGARGARKREAEAEIASIDSQKLMMKKACARTFGVRIGRLARQVPRWKDALSNAQQPQRPDGRGWRSGW